MEFHEIWYLGILFWKSAGTFQVSITSNKNNMHLTWRLAYIDGHTSPSSSYNEKYFRQSCRENQNTHFMLNNFFPKVTSFMRFFFFWRNSPPLGQDLFSHEVCISRTTTHRSRKYSSGRMIILSRRPLPDNTHHSQQTSMPLVGFEPAISADERPPTHALDRAVTGTGPVWENDEKCGNSNRLLMTA